MTSIARKWVMALSGLFLCLFLVGHLAGNLMLLKCSAQTQLDFNEYAHFMTTNPAVQVLRVLTLVSILAHLVMSFKLTAQNKSARSTGYAYSGATGNASFASKNMIWFGILLLIFLVLHINSFAAKTLMGAIEGVDKNGNVDIYSEVVAAFQQPWYVAVYVICMIGLAFHLAHGFKSAFQSMGARHPKYTPMIEKAGMAFGALIPLGFAVIPVVLHFCNQACCAAK